jgi:hypothetical protein
MPGMDLLYRLRVEHTYFRKRNKLKLGFQPLGFCKSLITKHLLHFNELPDGFDLYSEKDKTDLIEQILKEENPDHLDFLMEIKSHDFLNFTELDMQKGYHLILKKPENSEPVKGVIPLHKSDFVSSADLVDFSFKQPENIPKELLVSPDAYALIYLPVNRSEEIHNMTEDQGNHLTTHVIIRFKARSTYWKYLISAANGNRFDSLQVVDSSGQIGFTAMQMETDPEGYRFYSTVSDVALPLQEISENVLQLKGTQNGIEQMIISRLSAPNTNSLYRENGKLFSKIFIYY